jgi:hypothetical protein
VATKPPDPSWRAVRIRVKLLDTISLFYCYFLLCCNVSTFLAFFLNGRDRVASQVTTTLEVLPFIGWANFVTNACSIKIVYERV